MNKEHKKKIETVKINKKVVLNIVLPHS